MMLEYAYWITQALLALGALFAVYRLYRGPSVLDRVISVDVILIIVGSVMLADMAYNRHQDYILFVVITAVIGFLGAVAIARYAVARTPAQDSGMEAAKQAAGIDFSTAPEPEAPASPFSPTGGSGSADEQNRPDDSGSGEGGSVDDESTSWFANLTRSGFKPQPKSKTRDQPKGED